MKLSEIKLTPLLDTIRLQKISDETYFSKKYNHYISNSRLGLLNPLQEGSPDKFFKGFKDSGYSSAFELGSAIHELTLQNDLFELAPDLNKPTAKLGAMADELFKVWKGITYDDVIKASNKVNYYKDKMTDDKCRYVIESCKPYWESREKFAESDKEFIWLDAKSRETVISCVDSLMQNTYVQNLLHPKGILEDPISENEQAILLDVEAEMPTGEKTVLHLKSKLDNYTIDKETNLITINDVKSIGKILPEFENNIVKFHYHRELGMYTYLLKLCAAKFYGLDNPEIKANYLVVSTVPSYYTKVRPMTMLELANGFKEFVSLLKYTTYLICCKGYSFDE